MIVGPSDVASIMQLLEDDERRRVVARRLDVSPSVVADHAQVTRRLESTPGTGSMPFPGDNLKTRPFSYIVVSPKSHEYSLSPGN